MLAPHSLYNCGAKFYVAPGNSRNICKSNKHTESLLGLSEDITFYKLECTRNNSQGNYRLNGPVCVTTRKRDYYRKCCRNRLDPEPKLGKNRESKRPRAKKKAFKLRALSGLQRQAECGKLTLNSARKKKPVSTPNIYAAR